MQKLSKFVYLSFFFLIFVLCTLYFVLIPSVAEAQVPNPKVPCGLSDDNPEFNSLRPYQASPCGDSAKALYCGNDILIYETAEHTITGGPGICSIDEYEVNKLVDKTYEIALKDMDLQI